MAFSVIYLLLLLNLHISTLYWPPGSRVTYPAACQLSPHLCLCLIRQFRLYFLNCITDLPLQNSSIHNLPISLNGNLSIPVSLSRCWCHIWHTFTLHIKSVGNSGHFVFRIYTQPDHSHHLHCSHPAPRQHNICHLNYSNYLLLASIPVLL